MSNLFTVYYKLYNRILSIEDIERVKRIESPDLSDVLCNGCFNQYYPGNREITIDKSKINHLYTESILKLSNITILKIKSLIC